jgi:prophage antirepressor-like protein
MIDGKPHLPATECAKFLDYAEPEKAVRTHCKGVSEMDTPTNGGVQKKKYIPEGDLYRLIIKAADQSRNPEIKAKAEKFERWVFDVILPSIRKHETYASDDFVAQGKNRKIIVAEKNCAERRARLLAKLAQGYDGAYKQILEGEKIAA